MKRISFVLVLVLFTSACSVPITKKTLTYKGSDAFDKMLAALQETGWDIYDTDKLTGLITSLKLDTGEYVAATLSETRTRHHWVTVEITDDDINVVVSQPKSASFLNAGKYKTDFLTKEIIDKFNSLQ